MLLWVGIDMQFSAWTIFKNPGWHSSTTLRPPLDAEGSHAQGKEAPRGISLDLSNPVVSLP